MAPAAPFQQVLATLTLTPTQKQVLTQRYLPLLVHLQRRTFRISFLFHTSRIVVTVGSLIVPALLSIQYSQASASPTTPEANVNYQIYWAAWTISLFVTICNGLLTLFRLDKRYYYLHTVLEHLISEGWQYVELTGRFSGHYTPGVPPTHENQFVYFCHVVEKLRMRQIQEEYYKLTEPATASATPVAVSSQTQVSSVDGLIPPTPLRIDFAKIPKEIYALIQRQQSSKDQVSGDGAANAPKDTEDQKENQGDGSSGTVPVRDNV